MYERDTRKFKKEKKKDILVIVIDSHFYHALLFELKSKLHV